MARRPAGHFGLAHLSNAQLRHHDAEPVLLVANPRPSAGICQTAFTGVNLPWSVRSCHPRRRRPAHRPPSRPRVGGRVAVTEAATEVPEAAVVREVSVA
ncbi:ATP-grasp domain-containing protein [Streptomyces sp. ME03-5709C]|nr:ATP-grasp domain-containing protein [Streptomyces sp. ME03-5709C]